MRFVCILLIVAAAGNTATAVAQEYPAKAIRIVVPYSPGGGLDVVGRPIAQKLSESFGQTVVIDNRAGG